MTSINDWCTENKMVLNADKTKTMLIGSRQRQATLGNANILHAKINDTALLDVNCDKLLGVRIDCNLTWRTHVDYICYNGYILPVLDYCNTV